MKKFVSGILVGLILSFCTAAYGSSTIQDYLFQAKFVFNEIPVPMDNEYAVFNYNGHVYAPVRFMAENMAAGIEYDDSSKSIKIKQSNVKLDDYTLAPMPFVHYENISPAGNKWMQEVPLLQGSACWLRCIDAIRPLDFINFVDVAPVPVKSQSRMAIMYPQVMAPSTLEAYIVVKDGISLDEYEPLKIVNQRLTVPEEPGTYMIRIKSIWTSKGDTSYYFVIKVN